VAGGPVQFWGSSSSECEFGSFPVVRVPLPTVGFRSDTATPVTMFPPGNVVQALELRDQQ
jgi:hypothetical protein